LDKYHGKVQSGYFLLQVASKNLNHKAFFLKLRLSAIKFNQPSVIAIAGFLLGESEDYYDESSGR